jgi:hypothetical protein
VRLKPSIDPRERILVFGAAGTGKSNNALAIARKSGSHTFVIDNDMAYDRMLATDFTDLDNVTVYNADEWSDYIPHVQKAIENTTTRDEHGRTMSDDWLVVDMMTDTWDAVQADFVEQIHGKEIDEYFLEVRKAKKAADVKKGSALGALEGWMDWPVINTRYSKLYKTLLKWPGHLYCTAELAQINADTDDKDTRLLFGSYGVKPKGQKRMPHIFNTVLLMSKSRVGEYRMTTVKDRGREEVEDEPVGDFAMTYLRKLAGWKPGR